MNALLVSMILAISPSVVASTEIDQTIEDAQGTIARFSCTSSAGNSATVNINLAGTSSDKELFIITAYGLKAKLVMTQQNAATTFELSLVDKSQSKVAVSKVTGTDITLIESEVAIAPNTTLKLNCTRTGIY